MLRYIGLLESFSREIIIKFKQKYDIDSFYVEHGSGKHFSELVKEGLISGVWNVNPDNVHFVRGLADLGLQFINTDLPIDFIGKSDREKLVSSVSDLTEDSDF